MVQECITILLEMVKRMRDSGATLYVIFYGDFERPLRRRFREVFAQLFRENCPQKILEMIVFIAAIDFVKFSSKSELSSQFFGRLNFSAVNGALMAR